MCIFQSISPCFSCADYCTGWSANRFPSGSTTSQRLADLRRHFSGCKVVDGSINIALPDPASVLEDSAFDFLCHLKEITGLLRVINVTMLHFDLPNLILIRGRHLTLSGNALEMQTSSMDSFLGNLREISKGHMSIHDSQWCGHMSVNWADILEDGQLITPKDNSHLKPNRECNKTSEPLFGVTVYSCTTHENLCMHISARMYKHVCVHKYTHTCMYTNACTH